MPHDGVMPGATAGLPAAMDDFAESVATIGLTFRSPPANGDTAGAGSLLLPDGRQLAVLIKAASLLSADGLVDKLQRWGRAAASPDVLKVVVAGRITDSARELLRGAGWSWLDLRGHLRLAADGLLVDAGLAPVRRTARRREPFAGRVGVEVAVAALLEPTQTMAVRRIAGQINRAPSSVSEVVSVMRDTDLVTAGGLPRTPQLFWELASVWKPAHVDVAALPRDGGLLGALRVNLDESDTAGWALSEDRAAVVYGAPAAIRGDHPYVFYVPDERVLRRAAQLLGPAHERGARAATLRVAPVSLVCSQRQNPTNYANLNAEVWPMARPLFVALDLAQDPGRGREILADWQPPDPWARVW